MGVLRKINIDKIIAKHKFTPGFAGIFFNHNYFIRKGLVDSIKEFSDEITGKVIDIGCGTKPYESLFNCEEYVGLEMDTPENRQAKNASFFYNGNSFPFSDNEFDSAIISEVFEHIFNPDNFLSELKRILKPGGKVLFTIPFVWHEHEQPYDYARYSSFGIIHLLKNNGFIVIDSKKSCNNARCVFQLTNTYFHKIIRFRNWRINFLLQTASSTVINICGIIFGMFLPSDNDLYLNNIILAKLPYKNGVKIK